MTEFGNKIIERLTEYVENPEKPRPAKWITEGLPTDTQGWVYQAHFKVPFKAPQLEWIAKQYPNVGTWLSACDRFSVHVTDQGKFYACMAEWATKPYPWDGDNEFDTFAKATGYCETYAAPLPSGQTKEEA